MTKVRMNKCLTKEWQCAVGNSRRGYGKLSWKRQDLTLKAELAFNRQTRNENISNKGSYAIAQVQKSM